MRRALRHKKVFRAVLVAHFPEFKTTSRTLTMLIVLKDFNAFKTFQPRDERGRRSENIAGYFTTTPHVTYMALGAFGDRDATLELIFHEYTHLIVHHTFCSLPTSVN